MAAGGGRRRAAVPPHLVFLGLFRGPGRVLLVGRAGEDVAVQDVVEQGGVRRLLAKLAIVQRRLNVGRVQAGGGRRRTYAI